jgi:hypothetical protein
VIVAVDQVGGLERGHEVSLGTPSAGQLERAAHRVLR